MATILVRIAVTADAADIARLAGELGYPVDLQQMQARLSALLKSPMHFIAVAEQENARISGWVHVEHRCILEYGERAEIVGLVVAATTRRTGVATSLIASGSSGRRNAACAISPCAPTSYGRHRTLSTRRWVMCARKPSTAMPRFYVLALPTGNIAS